jgi:hypothetical protein
MSSSRRLTRAWTEGSPSEPPYNTDGNGECKSCWAWHPLEVGRPLTPAEIREINNQGTAVAVPEGWHRSQSRTYGGRNRPGQIAADAAEPAAAAIADSERMIEGAIPDFEAAARAAAEEIRRRSQGN